MTKYFNYFIKPCLLLISFFSFNWVQSQALLRSNNALDFDGFNDVVEVSMDTALDFRGSQNFTLEAWVYCYYFNQEAKDAVILSWYDVPNNKGYYLAAGGPGRIYFGLHNDTVDAELISGSNRIKDNQWHHIAATYNKKHLRIYVDGILRDSMQDSLVFGGSFQVPVLIGGLQNNTQMWSGKIDEVRIWDYARTSGEVSAYFNNRFCGFDSRLKASYTFNQGRAASSNSTLKKLIDFSGYGHDGVLKNFGLSGTNSNWTIGYSMKPTVISSVDTVIRCDRYGAPSKRTTFTNSGTYYDTIYSVRGCDSAIKIILTIKKSTYKTLNVRACKSYTVPSGTKTYTVSGIYTDVIPNFVGCDSIITINLKVGRDSTWFKYTVCDRFVTPIRKREYFKSGIYSDTLLNVWGCDSVLYFDVLVLKSSRSKTTLLFCDSVMIPTNKKVVKNAGVYYDTLVSANLCDSIIEYQVVSKQSFSFFNDFACESYSSATGKVYKKSGIYKDTLVNYKGCDSIITVNLTIYPTTYGQTQLVGCRKVRSLSRKRWYYTSGVYLDTILNLEGCDSVVSQTVSIYGLKDSIFRVNDTLEVAFDPLYQYQWYECGSGFTPILGENKHRFKPLSFGGSYACKIISGSCADTSECFSYKSASIKSYADQQIRVYPNPTTDGVLTVDVPSNVRLLSWKLYSIQGVFLGSEDMHFSRQVLGDVQLDLKTILGNSLGENGFVVSPNFRNNVHWYILEVLLSNGSRAFFRIAY